MNYMEAQNMHDMVRGWQGPRIIPNNVLKMFYIKLNQSKNFP